MLKEQRFGVEVEMTGITRKKAADILAEVFGTTAGDSDGTCYYTRIIRDQKNRKWKVMRDSSITPVRNDDTDAYLDEYKVEMVTPPLDYEDIELLQSVIRKLREGGAKPHSRVPAILRCFRPSDSLLRIVCEDKILPQFFFETISIDVIKHT